MNELTTLIILILICYGLYRLNTTLRNRRQPPEKTVLETLGYDPGHHDLVVTTKNSGVLTGTLDNRTTDPLTQGATFTEISDNPTPGAVLTYIPPHEIVNISLTKKLHHSPPND